MITRMATASDAAEIARIHVDTWRAAYKDILPDGYLSRLSKVEREQKWVKTLSTSTSGVRVAITSDEEVIGWTSFGPNRDSDGQDIGELYAIYLDHSYWGKGIGRELMVDALSRLQEMGFSTITLWVLQESKRARTFYEKLGFRPDGTSKSIEIDGKELIELRYRKEAQRKISSDTEAEQ